MGHYSRVTYTIHFCLELNFFHLILQLGGTYAIMGRGLHNITLLGRVTGNYVAYGTNT